MSTIPFKNIPRNLRVPLFYAEVDPSRANTAQVVQRALLIGQKTSSGDATANVPLLALSISDVRARGGINSQLARMMETYRANDPIGEVWILPLHDDPSAVAATGTITFTAAATASGTLYVYVAGVLYALPVTPALSTANLATNLTALINADKTCVVTASVTGSVVTLTADNKGTFGNDVDIQLNYLGTPGGQSTPAGLGATIVAMSGGLTDPDMTLGLAALGDMPFDFIVSPYTDTTSMNLLQSFLNDTTGRWSWTQQVYGHVFAARKDTVGHLVNYAGGGTRNNQHESVLGFKDSPTLTVQWAAAMAGAAAVSLRADPGTPLQSVVLQGILAPPLASRFVLTDRNTLLFDGISTYTVDPSGAVHLENVITTYQLNAFSQPDDSYLEVETMFLLTAVLRRMAIFVTSNYGRMKLAANGTKFAEGANIVTPNVVRAGLIALYGEMENDGLVQGTDVFAAGIEVVQNAQNPNRLDVLWPGILVDQLRIFALLAQFRLAV